VSDGGLAAVERAIAQGGDADDILRGVVNALVDEGDCRWAGIFFAETGALILGPEAGEANEAERTRAAVAYQGDTVAELAADGCTNTALLDEVAVAIAPYCLVGWDTGGVPWDEAD
jgi:putative methionine-R-sulfoxide reductase with GAF domain